VFKPCRDAVACEWLQPSHVFLAVGKLLFGRQATSEAINFAVAMVGAKPVIVKELDVIEDQYFDFLLPPIRETK
jgi:hypothetical protein